MQTLPVFKPVSRSTSLRSSFHSDRKTYLSSRLKPKPGLSTAHSSSTETSPKTALSSSACPSPSTIKWPNLSPQSTNQWMNRGLKSAKISVFSRPRQATRLRKEMQFLARRATSRLSRQKRSPSWSWTNHAESSLSLNLKTPMKSWQVKYRRKMTTTLR